MTGLDLLYIPAATLALPLWARKKRRGWGQRLGHVGELPPKQPGKPRIVLHGVSVGEVSALRSLAPLLSVHAEVVIATTTDTGMQRAVELFGATCSVVRYPLDFSWSVNGFLDRVQPDAVALVELEIWPQFVALCEQRSIPVAVINGRLSERSFARYRRFSPVRRAMQKACGKLAFAAVQDEEYAQRFEQLGVDGTRCLLTGSMKWDAAAMTDQVPGADELARELGIDRSQPLVVGGSTAENEEALLHLAVPAGVQLLCAPRKPEHFEQAARDLPGCVRRSKPGSGIKGNGRFLLDSIGELRQAYSLADVVVVGRSFGTLFGSDPIEPIALGKPTIIGPSVADFAGIVRTLLDSGGLAQATSGTLGRVLRGVLHDANQRKGMIAAGRACIREQQGASARHTELLLGLVADRPASSVWEGRDQWAEPKGSVQDWGSPEELAGRVGRTAVNGRAYAS